MMTRRAIFTWIVQAIVTSLVYRDLSPEGSGLVARSLGLDSKYWVWIWLIGFTIGSLFMNTRIAANTFAAYTGKRPSQDWSSYGQSGAAPACYWCGLTSFALSLVAAPVFLGSVTIPSERTGGAFILALVVNAVLMRFAAHVLFRRQYGHLKRRADSADVRLGFHSRRCGCDE
jgi:uncharacterized membrane protein (DUF485 family)